MPIVTLQAISPGSLIALGLIVYSIPVVFAPNFLRRRVAAAGLRRSARTRRARRIAFTR